MNHIDAIEGTVCMILQRIHQGYLDGARDDSDFIGNIKLIIGGVQDFIQAHPELMIAPDVVYKVLYDHAKRLWLSSSSNQIVPANFETPEAPNEAETTAYRHYYFDYLYQHGAYPR